MPDPILAFPRISAGSGGADRDRTGDPLLAKQVLSQLSYGPKSNRLACRAGARGGQSPPTPRGFGYRGFGATAFARCASEGWWAREDLNFRPHAYQARALTS